MQVDLEHGEDDNKMSTNISIQLFDKRIPIFDIQKYFLNDRTINKMNTYLKEKNIDLFYDYARVGGGLNTDINEIVISLPILIQSLSFDALYDVLRYLVMLIFEKVTAKKVKQRKMKEKPTVYFKYRDECIQMDFDFNLTKEQKDKIIDTLCEAIQEAIKKEEE